MSRRIGKLCEERDVESRKTVDNLKIVMQYIVFVCSHQNHIDSPRRFREDSAGRWCGNACDIMQDQICILCTNLHQVPFFWPKPEPGTTTSPVDSSILNA